MKKHTVWICLSIISAIIILLIVLQISYIDRVSNMLSNSFDNNVQSMLYKINEEVEAEEMRFYADSLVGLPKYNCDLGGEENGLLLDELSINTDTFKTIKLTPNTQSTSISKIVKQRHDQDQECFKHNQSLLNDVIFKLLSDAPSRPIQKRINFAKLNVMIEEGLEEYQIKIPYYFIVTNKRNGKVEYFHASFENNDTCGLSNYSRRYSQVLFPKDRDGGSHLLTIGFRPLAFAKSVHVLITPIFISSMLLLLVAIVAIVYIVKQRKLSQIKTDFTNNMTHELKTPVSTIIIATEMLMNSKQEISDSARDKLSIIKQEAQRLKILVDRTLETSILDNKKAFIRPKEENAHTIIQNAIKNFAFKVEHNNGKIVTDLNAENAWCMIDKSHFENVIINLMENAVKYSREQLLINISTRNDSNGNLIITVADNGIGIKKEYLKHIFKRFYRVPTGNVHDVKGYGLGLAYVKRIIEGHHAKIDVNSEFGLGTTFTITISNINKAL